MVTQELLDNIIERYRQGQKTSQIKESLLAEGWEDIDIDQAISQLQTAALQQIPLVATFAKFFSQLDERTSRLPPHMVAVVLCFCALLLFAVGGIFYWFLDPLGVRSGERDKQREKEIIQIRESLDTYFTANKAYPESLTQLVPAYLTVLPLDPETGKSYNYIPAKNIDNYQLCVSFETKAPVCISPVAANTLPIVVPPGAVQPTILPTKAASPSAPIIQTAPAHSL